MFCAHFFAKCILLVCQFRLFYQPFLRLLQVPVPLLCRRLKVHCTFKCFRPGKSDGKREKTPEKSPMWHSCKQTKKRSRKKKYGKKGDRQEWRVQFALAFRYVLVLVHSPPTSCSHFHHFHHFPCPMGLLGDPLIIWVKCEQAQKKGHGTSFFF